MGLILRGFNPSWCQLYVGLVMLGFRAAWVQPYVGSILRKLNPVRVSIFCVLTLLATILRTPPILYEFFSQL